MLTGVLGTRSCRQAPTAGQCAPPFEEHNIVPDIIDMAVAFAIANFAKPTFKMQRPAGFIAGNNLRLQGPVGFGLGRGN